MIVRVETMEVQDNALPTSIVSLRHLCLIGLPETRISKLPGSFCSLYIRQVLKKLRVCRFLGALPSNMSALVTLTHVNFQPTSLPPDAKNQRNESVSLIGLSFTVALQLEGSKHRDSHYWKTCSLLTCHS